jgi:hypothetical protein
MKILKVKKKKKEGIRELTKLHITPELVPKRKNKKKKKKKREF